MSPDFGPHPSNYHDICKEVLKTASEADWVAACEKTAQRSREVVFVEGATSGPARKCIS